MKICAHVMKCVVNYLKLPKLFDRTATHVAKGYELHCGVFRRVLNINVIRCPVDHCVKEQYLF